MGDSMWRMGSAEADEGKWMAARRAVAVRQRMVDLMVVVILVVENGGLVVQTRNKFRVTD
jgi:hypothetical protein